MSSSFTYSFGYHHWPAAFPWREKKKPEIYYFGKEQLEKVAKFEAAESSWAEGGKSKVKDAAKTLFDIWERPRPHSQEASIWWPARRHRSLSFWWCNFDLGAPQQPPAQQRRYSADRLKCLLIKKCKFPLETEWTSERLMNILPIKWSVPPLLEEEVA